MGPSFEEIKAVLNTPGSTLKSVQNPFEKYSQGAWIQDPTVVKPVKYDVPMDAIYDRLSDGSYIRKYDNYLGATGNEDRLGREQSTGEQWGHGLAKAGRKTLNYALDATVGTIYGIGQAINDGKFDSFWNNDFSNKLDDWNKTLDNNLANYYTDEQKSMGVLRKLGTANFWANDFAGGLAFVGGALLPELALGALTGGATFAGSAAKFGFKTGLKSAMKVAGRELAEEAFDPTNYLSKAKGLTGKQTFNAVESAKSAKALDGGLDLLKATTRAKYYGTAGSIADTGLFLTRTSAFEAGMEARQNFKESIQNYTDKYIEKNGKAPSADELSKFTQAAASGANAVFGANMAILSVSNAAMFGKTFNIKGIQKIGNKLEGLENRVLGIVTKKEVVDGVTKTVLKDATRGQKLIGNAYKLLGKASVEGLYEEGFQGVAGKTMQNYLENKYVNNNESYGYLASLSDAFKEQYTTNEGWTEMMVGMLIGSTAGVFTNPLSKVAGKLSGQEVDTGGFLGSIPGLGKNSRKAAHLAMKEKVDTINKGVDNLRSMNRASSAKSFRDQMDSGNTSTMGMEEALLNRDFIKSQDSLKTPTQILEDFTAVIEHSDFNENGIADTIGEENVPAYKQKLITDFKTSLENHKRASSAVESLNLGKRLSDTTLGNQIELEDHIETMLYLGLDSKQKAASTARELDDLIGSEGLYDAMEFFNGISNENKEKVQELNNKKRELGQAKKLAEKYGLEMTGLRQTRRTSAQSEAKYNQTAEKAALAAEKILSLKSDIENLENVLAEKVDPNILNRVGGDIASNLDKIEQLDKYEDALRKSGRTAEADAVAYKILQYKMHSDMSRESATFFSKMVEQDFFNTKVGKKYKDEVIGTPYKMNKELEDLIANNDALIDNALSSRGITAVNRTEAMKALIDGNDQLSEREKAKVASLYRILLTATNLNRIKNEIQDGIVRVSTEESNGIDGDSIEVAEKININQDDLGTLSLLNEAIDKILSQVEFIRGNTKAAEQVEKLEKQLENLRQQKANLEQQLKTEQNATKESTEQEENSNEQSSSAEYKRTDTRQQTTGQTEGEQRDTTEQSTDSSNSTITSQIQEVDQKIAEVEAKIQTVKSTKFKIVESEDWKRLDELTKKGTLTDQEKEELDILKGEIDNWTLLTGVVADGFRLSDLLIQKNLLENTAIKNTNEPEEVSVEELISGLDLGDTAKGSGYNYSLFYYSVQAFRDPKTGLISVSGITAESLFEEMGVKFAKLGDSSYKIVINGEAFTVLISDQKKNIQFTDEAIESINANTNVSIAPTNKDIPTGYSMMYKFPAGQTEGELLQSNFNTSFAEEPSADDVYAMSSGDEVFFVIDPRDKHNKELLAPYKKEEEPIDTDKVDEAIVSLYEQKLASDSNLIELEKQLADAQAERDLATKPSDKSKASRRVTSLENRITKRQDKLLKDSTEDVEKINKKAAKAAKGKKDLKAIKESLVIHVVDKNGKRLQTLKAKNKRGVSSSKSDMIFEGLRDMIGSDEDLIQRLAGIPEPISLDLVGAKVEKVLLGHPNLNIIKNEDGSHSVVYKNITTNKNVVDIGFIENGVLKLRGSKEGVNTYYTKKFEDKKSKQRIPVIVFEKAGRKIAYPAKVAESEVKTHEEFENIYNADTLDSVKVVSLNKYLAANGIDINDKGNAFILAGKSNLNDTFFQNKLAQLNNLKYFYDLDAWLDSKNDLDNILKTQVMVNINLSNPIHSPKLKLDFTGLPIEIKTNVKNNTNSNMTRLFGVSNTSSAKSAKKNANSNLNEPC